jgi:hypothetical protein
MSYRAVISMAAAAMLGIACVSTDAMARGGGRGAIRGDHFGGFHTGGHGVGFRGGPRGGVGYGRGYRGVNAGRNINVGAGAVGATAVGAAALAPRYYNSVGCGVYPNPPC